MVWYLLLIPAAFVPCGTFRSSSCSRMSRPPAPPFTKTSRTSELAQGFLLWQSVTAWFRFAFQCAVTVGATVLPVQGGRFVRPAPRSAYTYTPSGASPAQLASPCFGPLGKTPTVTARGILGSSARCSVARPLSRSLRRRSRRLRGDTRCNASSPEYRLLALRRVSPRIRRTASSHVAQFGTRPLVPCLTLHRARFSS